jgi:hypothetical protein
LSTVIAVPLEDGAAAGGRDGAWCAGREAVYRPSDDARQLVVKVIRIRRAICMSGDIQQFDSLRWLIRAQTKNEAGV